MFRNPRAVRKRSISSSGLSPASRRRKAFSTRAESNTSDVLDWSAPWGASRPPDGALHLIGPVERHAGRGALAARLVPQQSRDRRRGARVGERVGHRHVADLRDRRRALAGGVQGQDELVDLVGPRGEAGLDAGHDDRHALVAHGQGHRLDDVHPCDVAALGGEPALLQQPRAQRVLGQRALQVAADQVGSGHGLAPSSATASRSSSVSRNQNQPRGASEQVGQFADAREARAAQHLLGPASLVGRQVERLPPAPRGPGCARTGRRPPRRSARGRVRVLSGFSGS